MLQDGGAGSMFLGKGPKGYRQITVITTCGYGCCKLKKASDLRQIDPNLLVVAEQRCSRSGSRKCCYNGMLCVKLVL